MQSLARNYEGRGTKRNSKMSNALQPEQRVIFQSHCMSLICLDLNKNLWGARMALWAPFAKEKTQGQRGGMGFVQGRISSDREERKLQSWSPNLVRTHTKKGKKETAEEHRIPYVCLPGCLQKWKNYKLKHSGELMWSFGLFPGGGPSWEEGGGRKSRLSHVVLERDSVLAPTLLKSNLAVCTQYPKSCPGNATFKMFLDSNHGEV